MEGYDVDKAVKLDDGIYWVGYFDESASLHCNPYIIDDGEDVVFIEPGSIPHYPIVLSKVVSIVDIRRINYILASHQDPDLCASIPKFEEVINRKDLKVVTHSRAAILMAHYGFKAPFYYVDQNEWKLTLKSGRTLRFIFTPYCHFPGMFVTYDEKSKILFSGDIFGAFSYDWNLFANKYYIEAMKAFHENYMPSKEILNRAMEKIEKLDIKMICPQHGSIIDKNIQKYINALKELDPGDYMYY